jgi:hypothetical protein
MDLNILQCNITRKIISLYFREECLTHKNYYTDRMLYFFYLEMLDELGLREFEKMKSKQNFISKHLKQNYFLMSYVREYFNNLYLKMNKCENLDFEVEREDYFYVYKKNIKIYMETQCEILKEICTFYERLTNQLLIKTNKDMIEEL